MDRIVDIATDGRHLSAHRGFLLVTADGEEAGRVPLDDIVAVVVHAHGVTWSTSLLVALAERGATVLLCGTNHIPAAICLPVDGHHAQNLRMRAQWEAKRPLAKQLWRHIIRAKIRWQGAVLDANGCPAGAFDLLARSVGSGDPDNVEAQAARRYWPLLMGADFRRDRDAAGANAMLNYGYAVMRAVCARAVMAAGLHPSIGVHHANRGNAFALADDLIEPFRPLVDALTVRMRAAGIDAVTPEAKQCFARLIAFDLPGEHVPGAPLEPARYNRSEIAVQRQRLGQAEEHAARYNRSEIAVQRQQQGHPSRQRQGYNRSEIAVQRQQNEPQSATSCGYNRSEIAVQRQRPG